MFYFHLLLINSLINSSKLLATSTPLLKMLSSDDPDGWGWGRVGGGGWGLFAAFVLGLGLVSFLTHIYGI